MRDSIIVQYLAPEQLSPVSSWKVLEECCDGLEHSWHWPNYSFVLIGVHPLMLVLLGHHMGQETCCVVEAAGRVTVVEVLG